MTVIPQPTITGLGIQEVFYGNITPVQLEVEESPTYTYTWWSTAGADYLTCNTCPNPQLFQTTEDATVYVQAVNSQGCISSDSIESFSELKVVMKILSLCQMHLHQMEMV